MRQCFIWPIIIVRLQFPSWPATILNSVRILKPRNRPSRSLLSTLICIQLLFPLMSFHLSNYGLKFKLGVNLIDIGATKRP